MPIYEYQCDICETITEVLQKSDDLPPLHCPMCQSRETMRKLVSAGVFNLKGGGFYKGGIN